MTWQNKVAFEGAFRKPLSQAKFRHVVVPEQCTKASYCRNHWSPVIWWVREHIVHCQHFNENKVEKDVEGKEEELFEKHVKHKEDYNQSVEIRTNSTKIVIS